MFFTADYEYYLALIKTESDDLDEGAMLIYTTKNVNIRGTEMGSGWKNVWNVSLKSGWNYILFADNFSDGDFTGSTVTATTKLPGEA